MFSKSKLMFYSYAFPKSLDYNRDKKWQTRKQFESFVTARIHLELHKDACPRICVSVSLDVKRMKLISAAIFIRGV